MAKVELTPRARRLRIDQTGVERLLWGKLRNRQLGGWKWKRQVPRGPYIADFACIEANVIVELDGGQHSDQVDYDTRRTGFLQSEGFTLLRIWNMEVVENLDGVCETILIGCGSDASRAATVPLTLPSPQRGEGF